MNYAELVLLASVKMKLLMQIQKEGILRVCTLIFHLAVFLRQQIMIKLTIIFPQSITSQVQDETNGNSCHSHEID